jgi:hypothetical protein
LKLFHLNLCWRESLFSTSNGSIYLLGNWKKHKNTELSYFHLSRIALECLY